MFKTVLKSSFCLMALVISMPVTLTAVAEDSSAQFENLVPVGDPRVAATGARQACLRRALCLTRH
jgi:hypothetical protein